MEPYQGSGKESTGCLKICARVRRADLTSFQCFQFFKGAGPVGAEKARQAAVGENLSAGLAPGAIVRFFIGVADAQDFVATSGARLTVASVDRHVLAECSYLCRKVMVRFFFEARDPQLKSLAGRAEQPLPFFRRKLAGESDWGELRRMQNLVGIGVANSAEETRISQRSFQGMVFGGQDRAKSVEIGGENVDSSGVEGHKVLLSRDEMQRGTAFAACFGKEQCSVRKIECSQVLAS